MNNPIRIDSGFFCPDCNRLACRCRPEPDDWSEPDGSPLDSVVSHDYADDGPDLWPDDGDWLD